MKMVEWNDLEFILRENGTVAVCRYLGSGHTVAIPETVQGFPVTEIARDAFYDAALKQIRIPAGITQIASRVFPSRSVVDEDAMREAQEYFDSRYGHNSGLPRFCQENREDFESAEMATHMVFYKNEYDICAIVDKGSCAEEYCREKKIPVRYAEEK